MNAFKYFFLFFLIATFSNKLVANNYTKDVFYEAEELKKVFFSYGGFDFVFYDSRTSYTPEFVIYEMNDLKEYPLSKYKFNSGDIVIDIGANIGIISIILAKLHPHITIYAYEPCPTNFIHLQRNLIINKIDNVKTFNVAVTGRSGDIVEICDLSVANWNGGASSLYVTPEFYEANKNTIVKHPVKTISLDDIFDLNNIKYCKLLKIDCEGAEYDILLNSKRIRGGFIEQLVGEFHMNKVLEACGYSMQQLAEYCRQYVAGGVNIKLLSDTLS